MPPITTPERASFHIDTNWPGHALDAAIDAAWRSDPLIDGPDGMRHVALPESYRLHDVSDPHRLPPYAIGISEVDDRASMVAFVNRFRSERSVIFADYDKLAVHAALDWHSASGDAYPTPGARRHSVSLVLRPSEEFVRWNKFEGELHSQAEFASFLEENAEDIVDPEPAVMIEISRDLEAVQGVNFKSSTRLESGDRAFVYESETHVKGELRVPRNFTLGIPLFLGEEPVSVRCAMRWKVTPQGLLLGFHWRRVEYQRQGQFRELATLIADDTGCPVFFGRVKA